MRYTFSFIMLAAVFFTGAALAADFETDVYKTSAGELRITFIGHGSLMLEFRGKVIQVDPWSKLADYSHLPKADVVLITHRHIDHLDSLALQQTCTGKTVLIGPERCSKMYPGIKAVRYGDTLTAAGIPVDPISRSASRCFPDRPLPQNNLLRSLPASRKGAGETAKYCRLESRMANPGQGTSSRIHRKPTCRRRLF